MAQDVNVAPGEGSVVPYRATDVSQVTFGSNLFVDPCGTCKYSSEPSGFAVWGPNNCSSPGDVQRVAVPFIAAATGVPDRILASIILHNPTSCPTNKVTLGIYTDACYPTGPGTLLVSGQATVPAAPCALAVAKLRNAPTLTAGTKYWVAATTNAAQVALDALWYASNNVQIGYNFGTGWAQFTGGTPGFAVQGSSAIGPAAAPDSRPTFGANLFIDPCTGCRYDSNASGFDVRGPDNCTASGQTIWVAVPFIATATGVPRRISAPVILHNPTFCPENKVTLSLYTDNCGAGPGTLLVSGQATVPAAPCALAVANLGNAPSLTAGTKYWVAATTNAAQSRPRRHMVCIQ